jgi:FkbM family methyltransferase
MDADSRVSMTLSCRDADSLPKVAGAGSLAEYDGARVQIMHNGVRVLAGAYHGEWMSRIIGGLRGHHEPQEEKIFAQLVACARPGSLIVELASFWAYYSLWFLREVPSSTALCIEPDAQHMAIGRRNAQLNGLSDRVAFVEAWVGAQNQQNFVARCESDGQLRALPCLDMNGVLARAGGRSIELLHMDCQGMELGFLQSMRAAASAGKVRFAMVSTHHVSISGSRTTHADCIDAIRDLGGTLLAEYGVLESFSGDGLVVASFAESDRSLRLLPITRNCASRCLFPDG